jgi:hypothetical protein
MSGAGAAQLRKLSLPTEEVVSGRGPAPVAVQLTVPF